MKFDIVEKGASLEIKDKESGAAIKQLYVGAGWDVSGEGVDLDLVAACLIGGKLVQGGTGRLVYFGDKTEPGVQLSADNTTGEGEGDDENITFDLDKVEADVDSIAIGIAAYKGADLSSAANVKFRGVNGLVGTGAQLFEAPMQSAAAGDTVLHAVTLKRGANGWTLENVGIFHKKGQGKAAIEGFASLFA